MTNIVSVYCSRPSWSTGLLDMQKFKQEIGEDISRIMLVENSSPQMVTDEYENSSKRPKTTSKVWDFFQKLPSQQGDSKALCKSCGRIYTAKTTSGTSHLRRHVDACLKRGNREVNQATVEDCLKPAVSDVDQPTVSHDMSTNAKMFLKTSNVNVDEVSQAIRMMIIVDGKPLGMVEDAGFRSLMSVACPELQLVSRKTFETDIISIYLKERENVRQLLATCPGRICLTSSTWKSSLHDHYNCVTAHYIDHEWKLQKRIISFKLIPPPYDSLSIGDEIALCMVRWNIEPKIFGITLENFFGDASVVAMLKSRLEAKKYLSCNGALFHVSCFTCILTSMVQASLNLIGGIIEKLRLSIKYVKQSPHRKKNFYIIAKTLEVDMRSKLRLDSPSQWNSIYDMLEIALRYKNAFTYLGEQDKNFRYKLSEDEWEKVYCICKFLRAFHEVICTFSAARYPTSSLYLKGVWKVYSRLTDMVNGPENFMTGMVKEFQSTVSQYWSGHSLLFSCAAVLDPRCKIRFVEYCHAKFYGSDASQYVGTIVSTLYSLFDEYVKPSSCFPHSRRSAVPSSIKNDREDNDGFEDYDTFQSATLRPQVERSQLDLYLEEPSYDLNSEIDVLEYWRLCSVRYPELSKMARDVLTIPVSTVASDGAFQLGSQLISPSHCSLKPKTLEAFICVQDWIKASDRTWSSGNSENKAECGSPSSSGDDADDY